MKHVILFVVLSIGFSCHWQPLLAQVGEEGQWPDLTIFQRMFPQASTIGPMQKQSGEHGDYFEFKAQTFLGRITVWLDSEGFPIKFFQTSKRTELPDLVRNQIRPDQDDASIERHWVALYEFEVDADAGEAEIYCDGWGRERIRVREQYGKREIRIRHDDVPKPIWAGLEVFLQGVSPAAILEEEEWGKLLIEVVWKGDSGYQELKMFPNGEVCLWEPPRSSSFPKVLEPLIEEELPEVLYLALYQIHHDGMARIFWADGTPFPSFGEPIRMDSERSP